MNSSIKMDYDLTLKQADQLETIAAKIDDIGRAKFADTLQQISASWKGDNAVKYLQLGEQLQEAICQNASYLGDIAEEIRLLAKRLREEDMSAAAIVKQ